MSTLETSYLDNPRNDAHCPLNNTCSLDIVDASGRLVILDAQAVLNLMDFLGDWRGGLKQAVAQVNEAFTLAERHGLTIKQTSPEYYQLLWPNGNVYTELLRQGYLLDAVQGLIRRLVQETVK